MKKMAILANLIGMRWLCAVILEVPPVQVCRVLGFRGRLLVRSETLLMASSEDSQRGRVCGIIQQLNPVGR